MKDDETTRRLRYEYFGLDKAMRLYFLIEQELITPDMADLIPLDFWKRGFVRLMQAEKPVQDELTLTYDIQEGMRADKTKETP